MEKIVTGGQMKELDSFTIREIGIPSLVLMERAGLSVYRAMREQGLPLERNLVLCGSGNNGADGVVIARLLHLAGYETEVCILGNPEHYTKEMEKQIEIGKKYGISFVNTFDLNEYTTIVDAIFGVGLSREVAGKYREIIENINASGKKSSVCGHPFRNFRRYGADFRDSSSGGFDRYLCLQKGWSVLLSRGALRRQDSDGGYWYLQPSGSQAQGGNQAYGLGSRGFTANTENTPG